MKKDNHTEEIIFLGILIIPVIWIALLIAPFIHKGLFNAMDDIFNAFDNPFSITWCSDSLRTVAIFLLIYLLGVGIYLSSLRNYRKKEEYGSAKWGNTKQVNKKYADPKYFENKLLSQNVRIGLDGKKHRRNLNTIIIGGSGAGKTRFYGKPNIMQCNTSFVTLDPKGEILRDTGYLLEKEGYVIKVMDLINMNKSHCYNPFEYIHDDKDVLKLITNLIRNTTPKGSQTNDPFWEKSETALLEGLCLFLLHEAPKEEQNFTMVMEMIAAADVREDDEYYISPLDRLFNDLQREKPNSLAVKQYNIYKQAAGKTAKSILISVGVRLAAFNLESIASITSTDELELEKVGERKTAIFAVIPDNDSTFNFLVGMLYTQLFQTLYYQADIVHGGELPVPVHFLMDEFANVALPDEFDKLLSTMRSRQIFVSIIIQNLAQIKALYKDAWESIVGNCDELYYLGGNEQSTHKFISEYLGKETLDTNTYGKSSGKSGSYSTNYQQVGRELLTADEVRLLDNDYALLFIRGERPIFDKKYDILKHPNVEYTKDGSAEAYQHGLIRHNIENWQDITLTDYEYELYSEQDLQEYFALQEKKEKEGNQYETN
ncbi:VirD4-like conjugal transfer protein, CD1115 family [Faecalibacillus intestinalis]|uniref:VirD4-like conjugal transfer protein, CD1115 family n=1 Tax=Faecalibacillus intestinalis TaxID=1982626 RepID=UPI00295E2C1E|nr:type IV secretory system conjugative DNA transfer family protein [Faecalibacillus intestinalis]